MKANELMIGDWVEHIVVGEQSRNHPMKVDLRGLNRIQAAISNSDDGLIVRPIPLTPEILEKNWFVPRFSDGCLTEYLIYKDIVDGLHRMYIRISYFNTKENEHKLECFDCRMGGCQIWIKYVHELQHALRLCGIEKEIEL